jgi:sulfur carrier protein
MDDRTTTIRVNGESEALSATTVAALLEAKDIDPAGRGVAVALNGAVVPRAAWHDTRLAPGDRLEIVRARQGG